MFASQKPAIMTSLEPSYKSGLRPFPAGYWSPELLNWAWAGNCSHYPKAGPPKAVLTDLPPFDAEKRQILQSVLTRQIQSLDLSVAQQEHLQALSQPNTYTVCTGQQIHIGGGPLFVWAKISSTLAWAKSIQSQNPGIRVVPVFWMATEDHDFDEIKGLDLWGKHYELSGEKGGPVGRISADELKALKADIISDFPHLSEALSQYWQAFDQASDLADAYRRLIHRHFAETGLLILDPDDSELKKMAMPLWEQELGSGLLSKAFSSATSKLLQAGQPAPAHVRDVNAFWLGEDTRQRIEECESLEVIHERVADISPNVLLRPLYQQAILPNLAYIAGPTEFRYWFQTTEAFAQSQLHMPQLLLREAWFELPQSVWKKLQSWHLNLDDMGLPESEFQSLLASKLTESMSEWETIQRELVQLEERGSQMLYKAKSLGLKDFKKDLSSAQKRWRDAIESEKQKGLEALYGKGAEEKMKEYRQRYFNWKLPVERSLNVLEWYMQNSERGLPELNALDYQTRGAFRIL